MRREGSALNGLGVVILKELSDHLTSVRMRVLEWLVVLVALAALYGAIQQIKDTTAEDPFLFLRVKIGQGIEGRRRAVRRDYAAGVRARSGVGGVSVWHRVTVLFEPAIECGLDPTGCSAGPSAG